MHLRNNLSLIINSIISPGLYKNYKEFVNFSKWSKDELIELQDYRLSRVLNNAAEKIPFYKNLIKNSQDVKITDFPILTKDDIIKNFDKLMSPKVKKQYSTRKRSRYYGWIEVKTGGSTGTPTRVIHNHQFRVMGRASRLFSQYLCGFPLGTPYIMLWGNMHEIDNSKHSIIRQLYLKINRITMLNAFRMDTNIMNDYLNYINNSQTNNIMGYVDSLYNFANYISSNKLSVKPIRNIMACAGTVLDHEKNKISDVFNAKVFNKYGSRDCTDIACECRMGGIHIYSNHVYIEIVDEKGNIQKKGESGRILVTLLGNEDFPLIRYEIGDIGCLSNEECACGMPYPLFKMIEGRTYELIFDTNGNSITPVFLRHLIGVVHNPNLFNKFQFIQRTANQYLLLLEKLSNSSDAIYEQNLVQIKKSLQKVLGIDAVIEIKDVENIPESNSGKFIYIRNEYSKPVNN